VLDPMKGATGLHWTWNTAEVAHVEAEARGEIEFLEGLGRRNMEVRERLKWIRRCLRLIECGDFATRLHSYNEAYEAGFQAGARALIGGKPHV